MHIIRLLAHLKQNNINAPKTSKLKNFGKSFCTMPQLVYIMNMKFHTFRRRDWLQQYDNAKSLQNFCKLLQVFAAFILYCFTLHV